MEILKAVLVKHFLFFLPLVILSGTRPPLIKLHYVCVCYYCNKNWHKNYNWLQRKDLIFRITKSFFFSAFLPGPKRWLTSSQLHMLLKIWIFIKQNNNNFFIKRCNQYLHQVCIIKLTLKKKKKHKNLSLC